MRTRRVIIAALLVAGSGLLASGLYVPAKAQLAQWLIHDAWQRGQARQSKVVPWSWADTAPVGRLTAPGHNEAFIVLSGASGEALAFGPGHMLASAAPGSEGHTIIGGHRDTHFAFLQDVRVGDLLELEGLNGQRLAYRVERIRKVNVDAEPLTLQHDRSRLTLVTCFPFDGFVPGGPWRYVVEAAVPLLL